ncbi:MULTISPECIES: hypothetical protein [unclassified Amycolatopsis]|uniref:hypothetical protein n=1 Tax=unclassified Amycolatopsis TaxID=2618356 RepID=UPI00106E89DF|nr:MULTISPECIES: hypothetical protein [unclassified Amycolatopsis]
MSDHAKEVLWSSERSFLLWRYGSGHSQLLFRSADFDEGSDVIRILFHTVSMVETVIRYSGPLSLVVVDHHSSYRETSKFPHMLIEIHGSDQRGFVAAGGVRITRGTRDDGEGELIYATGKAAGDGGASEVAPNRR